MTDLAEPVDRTHRQSLAAVDAIRRRISELKAEAAAWEPRPYTVEIRS